MRKVKKYWNSLKISMHALYRYWLHTCGAIFGIVGAIACLFSPGDIGITSLRCRFLLFCFLLGLATLWAVCAILFCKYRHIWQNGSGSITIRYGNIMKLGFPRPVQENKIVVIPVNTHFDTLVDDPMGNIRNPLVSANSLHGQWVRHMTETMTLAEVDQLIAENLNIQKLTPKTDSLRPRGNKTEYPIGTTAIVPGNHGVTFFLLALSRFDENNNAQCSDEDFLTAIRNLIYIYNKKGQGYPLYLPVMGTNLSRTGYSHAEAMKRILSILSLEFSSIHGDINLVIYTNDRDKITIWQE